MEEEHSQKSSSITEECKELGVDFKIVYSSVKMKAKKEGNRVKSKLFREFALASLSALSKSQEVMSYCGIQSDSAEAGFVRDGNAHQISALDCHPDSGVCGLQWKKHLGARVSVTLCAPVTPDLITANAALNSLTSSSFTLDSRRVAGDPRPLQGHSEVTTCAGEAKVVMMMEAFQFLFINSLQRCVNFFDPACHSVTHGGLLCFVVSDTSVFVRSPHIARRWYDADVIKTEYQKEMNSRIVLGTLAKAAGRFNKALTPLYVLSLEDTIMLGVKVTRGNTAAEVSVNTVGRLLHCRMCEEKLFVPQQLAPLESPYSLLPCSCKSKNVGKTAVLLGPMWRGPIFDLQFLRCMQEESQVLGLSARCSTLLATLQAEAACTPTPRGCQNGSKQAKQSSEEKLASLEILANSNTPNKKLNNLHNTESHKTQLDVGKRKCSVEDSESDSGVISKKKKLVEDGDSEENNSRNVPFYHNVNKLKKVKVPKMDKLVTILQRQGFCASRTHFEGQAVRTDANVQQFLSLLEKGTKD